MPKAAQHLVYETLKGPRAIEEVQRFRARVFGADYQIHFAEGIDRDVFDAYSIHCVVRDQKSGQIVACTRVVPPAARKKIGYFSCEKEFDVADHLRDKEHVYELGRTCVDAAYRGGNVLGILWMGMAPVVLGLKATHLIGAVSVNLGTHPRKLNATEVYLARKAKTGPWVSRKPFDFSQHDALNAWLAAGGQYHKKDVPSLFKQYRRLGATFSKQAYHDEMFNCVDYLVTIKITKRLLFKLQTLCSLLHLKQRKKK